MPQRPHVVQPVRQLDNDDPPVLAHGHKHCAVVEGALGRLVEGGGGHAELRALRVALDDRGDARPKAARNVVQRQVGVLDSVVEEAGDDGVEVHLEPGQDGRRLHRMHDEWLAILARLAGVRGGGELHRPLHHQAVPLQVPRRAREPLERLARHASAVGQIRPPLQTGELEPLARGQGGGGARGGAVRRRPLARRRPAPLVVRELLLRPRSAGPEERDGTRRPPRGDARSGDGGGSGGRLLHGEPVESRRCRRRSHEHQSLTSLTVS
mmetsp:Transcript_4506/g.14975  ORF Transcript_4506/g.14975 Transcript_4506/m.14975 type:complete len:267 (-) Transcript_4506:17-817(-)